MARFIIINLLLFSFSTFASETSQWEFKTLFDTFSITKKEGKYTIGNREVNPGVFNDFEQIFNDDTEYDVQCPQDLGNKPTATITAHIKEKKMTRDFFVEKSYVRDNSNNKCLYIMKEGLAHLPLHRNWFIGEVNSTLPIKDKLQVYFDGKLVFDFEKKNSEWQQNIDNKYIDWDYFSRVLDSLKEFPIDKRYHLAFAKEKKQFEIRTGREIFSFYLVGRNFWAVKIPKAKWLVASSAWALFDDFKPELWLSKYNALLLTISDKKLDKEQRSQAIQRLGPTWTLPIKQVYHKILLDPDDDNSLKLIVLANIKNKPTNENLKVLASSLHRTEDLELQVEITKALRIMNPKGPLLSLDKPEKFDEQIQQWQKWAEQLK
ncbi:MAG: hypothetical protein H6625_01220 [Bdellovibrionaceae bacterium]|nr:hypothetical protein [Pseudobdellovibrionaceae bacterium]